MKDELIQLFGSIWNSFKTFADRFATLLLLYGRFLLVSFAVSIIVPSALHRYLGLSHDVAMIIMKVLLTITPIFPTAIYAKYKEEDYSDEDYSMDLCFAVWVITIVCAWWVI